MHFVSLASILRKALERISGISCPVSNKTKDLPYIGNEIFKYVILPNFFMIVSFISDVILMESPVQTYFLKRFRYV